LLWNISTGALTFGTRSALFAARGLIWSYGPGASLVGLDPDTGKVSRTIDLAKAKSTCGGHLRCYPDRATETTFWTTIGGKPQQVVDLETGETVWSFTAGGRIDSSPTFHEGTLLFGAADGWVYCVTASEGQLIWRFRAAPSDRRIVSYGQVESLWPVHGSVLILKGRAIVSAGRSSWLDGGIHLFALDPATGNQLATVTDSTIGNRYPGNPTPGMLSDLMVSDGECAYVRCSRIAVTESAIEVSPDPSKERAGPGVPNSDYRDVLVATDGMLDSDWFHRGGFMLRGARGQALAADASTVYAVPVFSTWAHSPTYVPGAGRVRLVAKGGNAWTSATSLRVSSMVLAADRLFVAGPPDIVDPDDPWASYEGRKGAQLEVYSKDDGKQTKVMDLPAVPVYDGMAAADGRLFISFEDGTIRCFVGTE